MSNSSTITITDQFCGAGGSSLGASWAGAEIKLALNHWKLAIETHNHNFPNTLHDCTDIQACDPRRYPSTTMLITSPECVNHSLAKGKTRKQQAQLSFGWHEGKQQIDPAEERSRATMWDVPRFAEYHDYQIIIVENVVDARLWRTWDAWLHAMSCLDYNHEIVYLNSMFAHPTPQSRDRMYCVFWKRGNRPPNLKIAPPAWCAKCNRNVEAVQSWKNPKRQYGKYRQQYRYCCPVCSAVVEPYYYCAANAIDWSLPIQRIGDRAKPLKEKTLARIEAGLKKFARTGFLVETAYSHAPANRYKGVEEALPTASARQSQGLAVPPFLMGNYNPGVYYPMDRTTGTVTTQDHHSLIVPPFIMEHTHEYRTRAIEEALATVVAEGNHHSVIVPPFLMFPNQTGDHRNRDVTEQPYPTQTASLDPALIMPFLMDMKGDELPTRPLSEPVSTVLASSFHHWLVAPPQAQAFLTSYYGNDTGHPITEPVPTATTVDRHALVEPCEGDLPSVEDCGFRMLQPHEIQRAMAFPADYQVKGNQRERVRQLGNAVTPPVLQLLMERCIESLDA